jgi:hypothetical protein
MRKSWIALLVMMPCLFAYADENKCEQVSGGILTNFLTESGTVNFPNESGKLFSFTTLGTATGDLAGGIGVYIFSFTPAGSTAVANVHHHWVTYAGDTINLADATAKAYQVGSYGGIYAVGGGSYTATITGGTGRFANATGQLSFSGVLDQNQGTVVLRYLGMICFARP